MPKVRSRAGRLSIADTRVHGQAVVSPKRRIITPSAALTKTPQRTARKVTLATNAVKAAAAPAPPAAAKSPATSPPTAITAVATAPAANTTPVPPAATVASDL